MKIKLNIENWSQVGSVQEVKESNKVVAEELKEFLNALEKATGQKLKDLDMEVEIHTKVISQFLSGAFSILRGSIALPL